MEYGTESNNSFSNPLFFFYLFREFDPHESNTITLEDGTYGIYKVGFFFNLKCKKKKKLYSFGLIISLS